LFNLNYHVIYVIRKELERIEPTSRKNVVKIALTPKIFLAALNKKAYRQIRLVTLRSYFGTETGYPDTNISWVTPVY